MLKTLKIRNFALVEDVELSFDDGMSVLTGETGAGKSVIVSAIGLIIGDRADREHIRHGASKAIVEATFEVSRLPRSYRSDFADYLKDDRLLITREISRDGSSRVKINGESSTLGHLKEVTAPLAEIMGQHAGQMLLNESHHLLFLDRFGSLDSQREEVTELFLRWEEAYKKLKRVRDRREQLIKERELLLFQQKEIQDARIQVGEEQKLENERKILDSSRALTESAEMIREILDGEEHSILDGIRLARQELNKMTTIDTGLSPQLEQLTELDYQLEELRRFIEQYGSSVPDDPARLEEINQRLDELYRLKQKYGGSEQIVLDRLQTINQQLEEHPDIDSHISELEQLNEQRCDAYATKALALSEVRHTAARYLQKLVVRELKELAIDSPRFEFKFDYEDHPAGVDLNGRTVKPYSHGLENGTFLFSANPGEPLKSLVKTASGGEISRVLLALKAAEKKNDRLTHALMVFDEVDSGIGGRTAVELGKKLKRLADGGQMLVITHLHQIARVADHHYLAEKNRTDKNRAIINVTILQGEAIAAELDRMVALPDEATAGK